MTELTKEKVIKAVEETGFPLELRVADLFNRRGYFVANSLYYIDKDEGKGREIDIRALINRTHQVIEKTYYVRYCLLVECKRYKKRPWVVFTNGQSSYDSFLEIKAGGGNAKQMWMRGIIEKVQDLHPYFKFERIGRGYSEIFREGNHEESDSAIYGALLTATKAAIATEESKFAAGDESICIYYPLVVLDGVLWESYLNGGAIDASKVGTSVVSFYYESPNYKSAGFRVPIIEEAQLENFLVDLEKSLDEVSKLIFSDMRNFS